MITGHHIGMKDDEVKYICGHCDKEVTSRYLTGFERMGNGKYCITPPNLLLCPECGKDSALYTRAETVQPLPLLGETVRHLPDDVDRTYTEARIAFSAGAYNACMLVCRNILAYAANNLGSGKKQNFVEYVDHLVKGNHITRAMKDWADEIRQHGNNAAHDLNLRDEEEAAEVLVLTKYLLEFMFEVDGERNSGPRNLRSYTVIHSSPFF